MVASMCAISAIVVEGWKKKMIMEILVGFDVFEKLPKPPRLCLFGFQKVGEESNCSKFKWGRYPAVSAGRHSLENWAWLFQFLDILGSIDAVFELR